MAAKPLDQIIEAVLFASEESLTAERIAEALERQDATPAAIREAIDNLNHFYRESGRGFEIVEVAGGYKILSLPEFNNYIRRVLRSRSRDRLSQAALETLAIVAYRQPITRAEIDNIRGVDSGPILRMLVDRGVVRIVGRQESIGHPLLYGTTKLFLELFGLKDLEALPKADELAKMAVDEIAVEESGELPPGDAAPAPDGTPAAESAATSPAVAEAMEHLAEDESTPSAGSAETEDPPAVDGEPDDENGADSLADDGDDSDAGDEKVIRLPKPEP